MWIVAFLLPTLAPSIEALAFYDPKDNPNNMSRYYSSRIPNDNNNNRNNNNNNNRNAYDDYYRDRPPNNEDPNNYNNGYIPNNGYGRNGNPNNYYVDSIIPNRSYGDNIIPNDSYSDNTFPNNNYGDNTIANNNYGDSTIANNNYGDSTIANNNNNIPMTNNPIPNTPIQSNYNYNKPSNVNGRTRADDTWADRSWYVEDSTTNNKNGGDRRMNNGGFAQTQMSRPFYSSNVEAPPHFLDTLKFRGRPQFDVVQKTRNYINACGNHPEGEALFDRDYVYRGPVIGPLNRRDFVLASKEVDLARAFPDLEIMSFGFTVDPRNPYRVFYFQQWTGTHLGTLRTGGAGTYQPTGKVAVTPYFCSSANWTPEGKIIYECVGSTIDRHEGNTEGKAAVFGLFHTAGLTVPANPGSAFLSFSQRVTHWLNRGGRAFSREEDLPLWWKSKSRGADPTDVSL